MKRRSKGLGRERGKKWLAVDDSSASGILRDAATVLPHRAVTCEKSQFATAVANGGRTGDGRLGGGPSFATAASTAADLVASFVVLSLAPSVPDPLKLMMCLTSLFPKQILLI